MPTRNDDEDDWVGEPPEGHYSRDRADPGFWSGQKPIPYLAAAVGVVVLILVIVLLL
jgi:hypothetical protein